jgi:RNA polymerase sigma-70 factor, ECF subfamily
MHSTPVTAPDAALIRDIAGGREQALLDAIAEYGGLLFGLARRMVKSEQLAEEIAQDVFVTLWQQADRFDPTRASLRTYLCAMTRNKAIDAIRKEESRRRTTEEVLRDAEVHAVDPVVAVEGTMHLEWVLSKLTRLQREAITLAYFGGRTYKGVAEELRIPEGTAKTRLRDALTRMRQEMVKGEPAAAG